MATAAPENLTHALEDAAEGHASAVDRLLPLVYDEMRGLAARFLGGEASDHTLQATALVHEAYLRLIRQTRARWKSKAHFFALAARSMRRVLIDHAERKRAAKRGRHWRRVALDEAQTPGLGLDADLPALSEALDTLHQIDERRCRIVELRFFSGLGVEDTARLLGISPRLVEMEWRAAREWLSVRLR